MGKVLVVRVKERGAKGIGSYEYKNEINGDDFNQIALILSDLENTGLPIDKAIKEFRKIKEEGFPF